MSVLGISTFWFSLSVSSVYYIFKFQLFNRRVLLIFLSLLALLCFNVFSQFIHASFELYVIKVTLIGIILLLNAYFVYLMYFLHYGDNVEKSLIRDVVLCAFVNALFAIVLTMSGPLRSILFSVVDTHPANAHHLNLGIRSSGLFYFGGSILSVFDFIALYLVAILLSNYKLKQVTRFFYVIVFLVITLGLFLAGRFGVVLSILGCLFILVFPVRFHLVNKRYVLLGFTLILALFFFMFAIFYDAISPVLDRSLEIFINMYNGDGASSDSTDVLGTMYLIPQNIFFGDGSFGRDPDVPYIPSDIGYVLMFFYSGMVGLLMYFLHFAQLCFIAWRNRNCILYSFHVFVLCLACYFIGNFKDVYFYGSQGVTQLFLIFLVLCCGTHKNYNDKAELK